MQPNPNGVNPTYQQPQYAPPAGAPQAPQWEQPQSIPNQGQYAPPVPGTENHPIVHQDIRPPEANASSFIPDVKTKEILDRTYPELTNALINLAIKKFSEDSDYSSYFVREEFKEQAQRAERAQSVKTTVPEKASGAGDFSTW